MHYHSPAESDYDEPQLERVDTPTSEESGLGRVNTPSDDLEFGEDETLPIFGQLPLDLVRIILEDVARESRYLAMWMCHSNQTLQQWIEPIVYHTIDAASSDHPQTLALLDTLQSRPDSFFHKHVKVLRLGMHLSAQHLALLASKCLGIHSLECLYTLPLEADPIHAEKDLDEYFTTLLAGVMKPSKVIIDADEHRISCKNFTLHAPLFQDITHLELLCLDKSKSIGPELRALRRLLRLKVQVWFRHSRVLDVETYKQCVDRVLTFCPPTVQTCVFFCAELPLQSFPLQAPIAQMARGEYDHRLVLGSLGKLPFGDEFRAIRGHWCLSSTFGEDVWEEAERIIRSRTPPFHGSGIFRSPCGTTQDLLDSCPRLWEYNCEGIRKKDILLLEKVDTRLLSALQPFEKSLCTITS
ncbi:hypothetical protein BDN72DRAFT_848468 [Pluteus cervinus]|uniref:Uncharacterized protein n=1 Tax=Pluteus cervinus TaxID=181527 RepID=A0ACD3AAD5_9AGAR|nr:hypothetical protein BDN72DRAFT_848468 [Pluteus cervinus]